MNSPQKKQLKKTVTFLQYIDEEYVNKLEEIEKPTWGDHVIYLRNKTNNVIKKYIDNSIPDETHIELIGTIAEHFESISPGDFIEMEAREFALWAKTFL